MSPTPAPTTALCRHTNDAIFYRENNLVTDLLGHRSFTDVLFSQILARQPSAAETVIIDAVLVALMEHGLTPSAIAARLTYMSSPENIQAGVAAGLLCVGSQFIGTMEDCASLLHGLPADDAEVDAACEAIVREHREHRRHMPGFGHHLHKPDDPRSVRLLALAEETGIAARHVRNLRRLSATLDRLSGKHLTVNATGAVAALLGDLGVPVRGMRGFATIARAAGLVAHLVEEQSRPSGRFIWDLVDHAVPFAPDA